MFLKTPLISVVVPVWQEGEAIVDSLRCLAKVAGGVPYEVIVVDGDSQGSTVRSLGDFASQLGVEQAVQCFVSQKGRANQMNYGAGKAIAPVLLFLHADSRLPVNGLATVIDTLRRSPEIVGGAFDLQIDSSYWLLRVIAKVSSWRSRFTRIPYGDQGIFIRRSVFEQLGGFADVPLMEDVILMRAIKRQGMSIRLLSDRVQTSARRWNREGVIQCTLRNWMLILLFLSGVKPQFLARFYR